MRGLSTASARVSVEGFHEGAHEGSHEGSHEEQAHDADAENAEQHPHDADVEAGDADAPKLKTRIAVPKPSLKIRKEHEVTHIPYAPWCETCIRGRGIDHPHRRRSEAEGTESEGMHKVHFDYGFFRLRRAAKQVPFLVGVCARTGMKFGSIIFDRRGKAPRARRS